MFYIGYETTAGDILRYLFCKGKIFITINKNNRSKFTFNKPALTMMIVNTFHLP